MNSIPLKLDLGGIMQWHKTMFPSSEFWIGR
jgi:hypothetical protein